MGEPASRALEQFRGGRVLVDDLGLKAKGERMVRGKITVIQAQTGRRARVWAAPAASPVEPGLALFDELGLDRSLDLLLVFNGRDWAARGWGLEPPEIDAALVDGRRGLDENWAHGLVAALIALDLAADERGRRPPLADAWPTVSAAAAALVVGGGVLGWVLARRARRQREAA